MAEHRSNKMILRIIMLFLFIVLTGFLLFFIYGIFIPAVKPQIEEEQDPLFSEVELNYIDSFDEETVEISNYQAVVLCSSNRTFEKERLKYNGIKSCALFSSIYETANDCKFGCIGFGDCAKVCPQEAIVIKNGTAVITDNCCGCKKCVSACPKQLIHLFYKNNKAELREVKLCNVSEDCITTCSQCRLHNKTDKFTNLEQKHFKFWKSCYKILNKKQ